METRELIAYGLILVMAAALIAVLLFVTRERRAHNRNQRLGERHRRSKNLQRIAAEAAE